jgi:predicted PurR-regulated permease PerM
MTDERPAVDGRADSSSLRPSQPDRLGMATVPAWLATLAGISWRVVAVIALFLVLLALAVLQSVVVATILFAFLVAAFVAPLDTKLRSRGLAPTKAASITSVVALLGTLGVALLIILGMAPAIADLVRYSREGADELAKRLQELGANPEAIAFITGFLDSVERWASALLDATSTRIGDIGTVLILGAFLTFYVLQSGDRAWSGFARGLTGTHYDTVMARASLALGRVSSWLRGTFVMAAFDALTTFVFLWLLEVPLAAPLAVIVFIGGAVPYLGAIFTVGLVVLVTWATQGLGPAALLLGLIVAVNIAQTLLVSPRVYGSIPRISPALVVVALPAGATLFGILGLIVAVPIVVVVSTLLPVVIDMLDEAPEDDRTPSVVPLWLDRLAQWSWRAVAVIVAGGALITALLQVPIVTLPAILAAVLAATLRPLFARLRAAGAGPTVAAAIAIAGSAAAVGLVIGVTLISIAGSTDDIVGKASEGAAKAGLGDAPVDLVGTIGSAATFNLDLVLRNLFGVGLAFLMVMFLTFFLLRDGPRWLQVITQRLPEDRRRPVASIFGDSADILSGYMLGTGAISLFAGVTAWLMMVLLNLPLAVPVGVLTFFLSFIPYIGDAIATLLAFLIAVAVGTTSDVILMGVYTMVINVVQGNIVAPLVYRRTVSLHPAIVLLSAPAGAAVGGMMGMFLVVPFLGIIAATWRPVLRLFDPTVDAPTPASTPASADGAGSPAP